MENQDTNLVFGQDLAAEVPGLVLTLKKTVTLPLEAECITPDNMADKDIKEIEELPVLYGRRKAKLGDFFEITGKASEHILVQGDLTSVKKLGSHMTKGVLHIKGDAGPHLGSYMTGGIIWVEGSVGDWAGAMMKAGRIWITGNARNFLGSAYSGEKKGVNKGIIVVMGNVGSDCGIRVRRGLIVVKGDIGDFAGQAMLAGTIVVFGKVGERAGANNKRGSIMALGNEPCLLPTYKYDCTYKPSILGVFFRRLRSWGLDIPAEMENGFFKRYSGDVNALAKGEILIYEQSK